jgi:tetratricopeptide (TPR) repeat protein
MNLEELKTRSACYATEAARSIREHWKPIVSLLAAASALVAVLSYVRSEATEAKKEELAKLYEAMGRRQLLHTSDWVSARDALEMAVKLDEDNIPAHRALLVAKLLKPASGENEITPESLYWRIKFLSVTPPFTTDSLTFLLQGEYFLLFNNPGGLGYNVKNAKEAFQKAYELDRENVQAIYGLGLARQYEGDIEGALGEFEKIQNKKEFDPSAYNALGYCYLLTGQFVEAVKRLELAEMTTQVWESDFNLADAYYYSGNTNDAERFHRLAVLRLAEPGAEKDWYARNSSVHAHMPISKRNLRPSKRPVYFISRLQQKMAMSYFALALDNAMLGRLAMASEYLERSDKYLQQSKLDEDRAALRSAFLNRIGATRGLLLPAALTDAWLSEHEKLLAHAQ